MMKPFQINAIPENSKYNPSKWSQRVTIAVVAMIATLIAIYMGLYQWRLIDTIWDPIFKDQSIKVLDSDVSHKITSWVHIPDSILGALAYLGDVIFALAGSTRRWYDRPWLVILFGLSVIPVGAVSATLIFLQGTVVGSWCFLCLVTGLISLLIIYLAYNEVWYSCIFLRRVWKRSGRFSVLWKTFWGRASLTAHEVANEMAEKHSKKVDTHVGPRN